MRPLRYRCKAHLLPALLPGRLDTIEKLLVGEALVHNVPQPLRARLWCKREPRFLAAGDNVGDVIVKPVHALARQRQIHVLPPQLVLYLQPSPE